MPCIIFLFILVIVLVIGFSIYQKNRTDNNWQEAARELDLDFTSSGLFSGRAMSGTYEGYPVTMWTHSTGGNNNTYYTTVEVQLSDVPVQLNLKKDGFLSSIGTFLGAQDIEVGDAAFDRDIIIKGGNKGKIRSYLTEERMSKLIHFFRTYPYSEITQSKLKAEKQGTLKNTSRVIAMCNRAIRMARLLEGKQTEEEQQAEKQMKKGKRAQNDGNLPEARKQYKGVLETELNNVEALTQKANVEYMDQNYAAAADFYKEALRWEPNDPMIQQNYKRAARKSGVSEEEVQEVFEKFGISSDEQDDPVTNDASVRSSAGQEEQPKEDQADQPTHLTDEAPEEPAPAANPEQAEAPPSSESTPDSQPVPEQREPVEEHVDNTPEEASKPASEAQPEESPETDKDLGPDKNAVLQDLFDPQTTGVDAGQQFEKAYQGKVVTWSGTFLESKDLTLSLKFDSKEGGLMKVQLHSGKQGTEVKRDCYGFVHVTDGLPEDLEEGDSVTFRGTLFRLDEFMRNLYIADAKLQKG